MQVESHEEKKLTEPAPELKTFDMPVRQLTEELKVPEVAPLQSQLNLNSMKNMIKAGA